MGQVLTTLALNRALLARQQLLARKRRSVAATIGAVAGLQTQEPRDAYVALWSRIDGFSASRLERAMRSGEIVRASWLRCTIHTVTREDYLEQRALLDRVISPPTYHGRGIYNELSIDEVAAAAAAVWADGTPRTARVIGEELLPQYPQATADSLAFGARHHLRVVMPHVPGARWGYPRPPVLLPAEQALSAPVDESTDLSALLLRGIAAIGPCSTADLRTWSGLTGIKPALEAIADQLELFEDEHGKTLYDLPGAPRPRPSTDAPVRFLGEFDNVCLSHASRERIIDPEHAKRFLVSKNGRRDLCVLIDGFVRGSWKIARRKDAVELAVQTFETEPQAVVDELRREGAGLAALLEPDAASYSVIVSKR